MNRRAHRPLARTTVVTIAVAVGSVLLRLTADISRYGVRDLLLPGAWIDAAVTALIAVALLYAFRFLRDILRLPALPAPLRGDLEDLSPDQKRGIARQLLRHVDLDEQHRRNIRAALRSGAPLNSALQRWRDACRADTRRIITDNAVRAGLATALSQNGALDAAAVLYMSFQTLRDIYRVWGLRPGPLGLARTFYIVLVNTLLAGAIEELIPEDLLTGLAGRLSALFARSMIDGLMNAWLLLRFGLIAEYLILHGRAPSRDVRRTIRRESVKMLTAPSGILASLRKQAGTVGSALGAPLRRPPAAGEPDSPPGCAARSARHHRACPGGTMIR